MAPNVGLPLSVLALPFLAFVLLAVVAPLRRAGRAAGLASILAMALAFAAALTVWARGLVVEATWTWLPADGGPIASVGLMVDSLSKAMLVLVTLVSLLVQIYSENERRLSDAINRKDTSEIDRLVASDFELRPADNIGTPVPRADWLAKLSSEPPAEITIGQMAVHDFGAIRIVSFLMTRAGNPPVAVVDVWTQSGDASVLKVRYAAVQGPGAAPVPGETRPPPIEKKY